MRENENHLFNSLKHIYINRVQITWEDKRIVIESGEQKRSALKKNIVKITSHKVNT